MIIKLLIRGFLKKHLSFLYNVLKKKGTGGTDLALYCYSVWLRHLILLDRNGMKEIPKRIIEIGPGDSLGIGLNAILTGSKEYFAFDIIEHTNVDKNLQILEELIDLYKRRLNIPNTSISKNTKPKLENYDFPKHILSDSYLDQMLEPSRLNLIRDAVKGSDSKDFTVKYILLDDNVSIQKSSVDLIFSQAVMEHVEDVESTYRKGFGYLKEGGFMSHQIDYSSHETHSLWFGHWAYSKNIWKIINYGRLYSINRFPNSYHLRKLKDIGFKIIFQLPYLNDRASGIDKDLYLKNNFEDEDLQISSCFIISKKK